LSHNEFTEIPFNIVKLTSLKLLDISTNKLVDSQIDFSNLINLTRLTLSSNRLTYLPYGICQLTKLEKLYMCRNKLTHASVGQLVNLTRLSFIWNDLVQVPELDMLTNLKFLNMKFNNLTDDEYAKLSKLEHESRLTKLVY